MLRPSAIVLLTATAGANQVAHTVEFPHQPTGWTATAQLPLFDPNLGTLTDVTITASALLGGTAGLENGNPQAASSTYMPNGWVTTSFPFGWIPPLNPAYDSPSEYALGAFDGTLDFAGSSGFLFSFTDAAGQGSPTYTWGGSGSFVSSFVGPAGAPGTFPFTFDADDGQYAHVAPGFVETHALTVRAFVTVRYTYETFSSLCEPGQAGALACPCGNPPAFPERGCDNSAATGGAALDLIGNAVVGTGNARLRTFGELPTALSIVLQGDASNASGVVFGQGVRCVAGNLLRLYVENASDGSIVEPDPGEPSIPARSAALGDPLAPGVQRWYSVYYRDPVVLGGCPSASTFNVTQTLAVRWE